MSELWKETHDSHRSRAGYRAPTAFVCRELHGGILSVSKRTAESVVVVISLVFGERARDETETHEDGSLGNELLRHRGHSGRWRVDGLRSGLHYGASERCFGSLSREIMGLSSF
jgi:hypothetical protein